MGRAGPWSPRQVLLLGQSSGSADAKKAPKSCLQQTLTAPRWEAQVTFGARNRGVVPILPSGRHFSFEGSAGRFLVLLLKELSRRGRGRERFAETRKEDTRVRPRETSHIALPAIEAYLLSCRAARTAPRVSELARRLSVSRGTLISSVKKLRGITPAKYFRQRQVQCAKELIQRGWSIEIVAKRSGFGTTRTFFRTFRTETGTTPDAYRIEQNVPRQRRRVHDRLEITK